MAHDMVRGSEVPWIYGEPRVAFHAYRYARTRANQLFAQRKDLAWSANDSP